MILPGFIDKKPESFRFCGKFHEKPQIFREKTTTSASFQKDAGVAKELQFVVTKSFEGSLHGVCYCLSHSKDPEEHLD